MREGLPIRVYRLVVVLFLKRPRLSYVGSGAVASSPEGDEPAWTKGGEPVPYMPFMEDGSVGFSRQEIEEAEIPVEETNGPARRRG